MFHIRNGRHIRWVSVKSGIRLMTNSKQTARRPFPTNKPANPIQSPNNADKGQSSRFEVFEWDFGVWVWMWFVPRVWAIKPHRWQ